MTRDVNEDAAVSGQAIPGSQCRPRNESCSNEPPVGWKEAIRTFSPAWFTPTMGTSVTALLLNRFPYPAAWLHWLSILTFALSVLTFALAAVFLLARLTCWRAGWVGLLSDGAQLWFLGAAPIGFGGVVNLVVYVCVEAWGEWAKTMAWVLWMVNAVLAVGIAFLVPFVAMTTRAPRDLGSVPSTQLMPLAGPVAAALSGSNVARILTDDRHALWTIVTSYALWGLGMLGSVMILTTWYQRLILCGLPPRESTPTMFLPIAPLCLGSLSILQLGTAARSTFPATSFLMGDTGAIPHVLGALVALSLWGPALLWFACGVAAVLTVRRFPFQVDWWQFTFPPGMLALTTISFGDEFSAEFFTVLGAILAVAEILVWIVVTLGTVRGLVTGKTHRGSGIRWRGTGERHASAQRKWDEEV